MNLDKNLNNPSTVFYECNKYNIHSVRESLFAEIDSISLAFGIEARKILNEKLNNNQGKPLLGELFPWIINDLIDGNVEVTKKISTAWLAIYIYTLFLDEYVDNPQPLSSTKFLAGSVLAKTGLLKISSFINNTPYEKYVDSAFSFSAQNQNLDALNHSNPVNTEVKISYSKGKNYILLACAGALAAQNSKHSEFITGFTETLLLTLQYLDDLSDYKEDLEAGNFTVLLSDVMQNSSLSKLQLNNISNRELLEELLITGALQRVIEKIQKLLIHSITYIQESELNFKTKKDSIELFTSLMANISSFNNFLKSDCIHYKHLSKERQKSILSTTEKYIPLIAQST